MNTNSDTSDESEALVTTATSLQSATATTVIMDTTKIISSSMAATTISSNSTMTTTTTSTTSTTTTSTDLSSSSDTIDGLSFGIGIPATTPTMGGKADSNGIIHLQPEVEFGNIEYKLQLISPTAERLEHLVTQLKWRLGEGMGEAIYEIGVDDDGTAVGLGETEMQASLTTLRTMASRLSADLTIIRTRNGTKGEVYEVLIRKFASDDFSEVRICVTGNVDAGKSTLLGVLTRGQLDNGRGLARLNVFRHKHEIETGRTSSLSQEITTLFGMTSHAPDFSMLMVSANNGCVGMTKEHLGIALALRVPVFVVVTKIDRCPENVMTETMNDIKKILKSPGSRKLPVVIHNHDDVVVAARSFVSDRIAPIFCVSNVTGQEHSFKETAGEAGESRSDGIGCHQDEGEKVDSQSTTISLNYEAVVHCGASQQCARIVWMEKDVIRTGDKAKVRFRYTARPEFLTVNNRLIFREGRAKGIGRVTQLIPYLPERDNGNAIPHPKFASKEREKQERLETALANQQQQEQQQQKNAPVNNNKEKDVKHVDNNNNNGHHGGSSVTKEKSILQQAPATYHHHNHNHHSNNNNNNNAKDTKKSTHK
ncbi:GTP-binding protein 1 [Cavenderia fasciculata]|uniref:GTP-binding protein 1 n=1 Tax=Cavenderia fasciculata TaxID=261658 RepID=F4PG52_CACFS|nr:GTP-binding protein 1 [Cavenderia fasciculata]EGG24686.1 GTP-binding protein 1 [Cavenderia fasciculata]|eukprot:XP_004362537.1 GTP-binding protein 1 [Cavenderia fasciculata]